MWKIKGLDRFIKESLVTDEERRWLTYLDEMAHMMKSDHKRFIEGARHFGFPDHAIQDALASELGCGLDQAKAMMESTTFQDLYHSKNKWLQLLKQDDRKAIADNLFVLIDNSYAPLGGHPSVRSLDDIFGSKLIYWEAVDIDQDPEADTVLFGRKSQWGIKISGMGHDGVKKSRSELMKKLDRQLRKPGYWIEASDRVAELLYKMGTPYVDDQKLVERIFDQTVKWKSDQGQYERMVAKGKWHTETIFGRPVDK